MRLKLKWLLALEFSLPVAFLALAWLVPAWRCFTLPVAVTLNRFAAPLCVFCFGTVLLLECSPVASCSQLAPAANDGL